MSTEFVPLWKRVPAYEDCSFFHRPASAPNERDDHMWTCLRTYEVTKGDLNAGFTLKDLEQLKRVMIEQLSAESGGLTTEQKWIYEMRCRIWKACSEYWMTVWLE